MKRRIVLALAFIGTVFASDRLPSSVAGMILGVLGTRDGGFITVGQGSGPTGNQKGWMLKVDAQDKKAWEFILPSSGEGMINNVKEAKNGDLIAVGTTESKELKDTQLWLARFTADGKVIWEKTFGSPEHWEMAGDILETQDGSIVFSGSSYALFKSLNAWMVCVDPMGTQKWEVKFGDQYTDYIARLAQAKDGSFWAVGTVQKMWEVNGGMVARVSGEGKLLWTRVFQDSSDSFLTALVPSGDGSFWVGGWRVVDGTYGGWLVKMDEYGSVVSTPNFPATTYNSVADGLPIEGKPGAFVAATQKQWRPSVIGINAFGEVEWETVISGQGMFDISLSRTSDGGYVAAGTGYDQTSNHGWFQRMDENGDPLN